MKLCHKDTVILIEVTSTKYGNEKVVVSQATIKGTFLQDTGFLHSGFQDAIDADAGLYPDEKDSYILSRANRLEGMYVVANPYGAENGDSWYKITRTTVNRDHLLSNKVDNILCLLKKTAAIALVS